jgi:hypothetical protein
MKWSEFFRPQRCNYPCESVFSNPDNAKVIRDTIAAEPKSQTDIESLTNQVRQLALQVAEQRVLFQNTLDKCFGNYDGGAVAYLDLDSPKLSGNLTNGYAIQVLSLKQANASLEKLNRQSVHLAETLRARNTDLQANYSAVEGHNKELLAKIKQLEKPRKK